MNKIGLLRAALVEALPEFQVNPDRLVIFVDKGRLVSRLTPAMGYEWRYTTRLEFHEFTSSPNAIAVPLLLWLRQYQPDRLLDFAREDSALGFAADILDETTWDIVFSFELTEAVEVVPLTEGGWDIRPVPEPPIAGTGALAGVDGEILLDELIARATPVAR
jgi:hypothetical protein